MSDARPSRPGDEEVARPTLEDIPEAECLELLAATPVGRLGFVTEHGEPLILPVNHIIDDGDVAFRTTVGTKLDVAERLAGSTVVFEVDNYAAAERTGWSVIVKGTIEPVVDIVRATRLDRVGHHVWSDDVARNRWVVVMPTSVTGKRVVKPGSDPDAM